MHFVKNFVSVEKESFRKISSGMWESSSVRSMEKMSSKPKISFQVISSLDMIRTLSKPRSKSNLINIHMKFILLVIIGALLWNNNQARQFTSDSLQSMSDFIEPNQQRQIKLSFWIMTQTTDNIIDRDVLQEKYILRVIDSMDYKDIERFVYDTIDKNLDDYTVDELSYEVSESYPDLLGDTDEDDLPEPDETTGWNWTLKNTHK